MSPLSPAGGLQSMPESYVSSSIRYTFVYLPKLEIAPASQHPELHRLNDHLIRVSGERVEIIRIGGHDRRARLGQGDNQRVDGGALPSACPKLSCPSRFGLGNDWIDFAALQQAVDVRVSARRTCRRLGKNDGRYDRWPQALRP